MAGPTTLTRAEVEALLRAAARPPRDHLIFSLALGTDLGPAEIVGLDVGDIYLPDATPRVRVRLRAEIAKGGRAADVFLPDAPLRAESAGVRHGDPLYFARDAPARGSGTPLNPLGSKGNESCQKHPNRNTKATPCWFSRPRRMTSSHFSSD